jgi:hypothetical protein
MDCARLEAENAQLRERVGELETEMDQEITHVWEMTASSRTLLERERAQRAESRR